MTNKQISVFWYHYDNGDTLPDDRCVIKSTVTIAPRIQKMLSPVINNSMILSYQDKNYPDWSFNIAKLCSESVVYTFCVTAAFLATLSDEEIVSLDPQVILLQTKDTLVGRRLSWFCRHDSKIDFDDRFGLFLINRVQADFAPPTP